MRRIESWLVFGVICFLWVGGAQADPKNVIAIIVDGGGFEHYELGRLLNGGPLVVDTLDPNPGAANTLNVFGEINDSAGGATAIATGCKTDSGNISMAEDDLTILPTSMQAAQAKGMAVGLLSDVYMCDATPGVWLAHAPSRSCSTIIPQQIDACPDVLLGPGEKVAYRRGGKGKKAFDFIEDFVDNCGYEEVSNAAELAAATAPNDRLIGLWGGYTLTYSIDRQNDPGDTTPTLAGMAEKALEILSRDPDGFMMHLECGAPDWHMHNKDIAGDAREMLACDEAIQVVYDFAVADGETAVVMTADHECGGLDLGANPNIPFIAGVTASTDWMAGQVFREGEDPEDILETYAGVTDLTQAELDTIAAWPESGIADALTARANVQWILPTGVPAMAPEEGKHTVYDVPVYAFGPGTAGLFEGNMGSDDVGKGIFNLLGVAAPACPVIP